jgi:hypothetical protein
MLDIIETYVVVGFFGLLIGFYVTRRYYQRTVRDVSLGKIIEVSFIENKIGELESQIVILNDALSSLKEISEALEEEVKNSHDIERTFCSKFEIRSNHKEIHDI